MTRHCQAHPNRYPQHLCGNDAAFFVTYFVDGCGGMYCCAYHLSQSVRTVREKSHPQGRATIRVIEVNA